VLEIFAVGLGIALALLAGVLTGLAWVAWRRFEEGRFFLVGAAFLLVAVLAILAVVAELGVVAAAWYDEAFALEPVPLALLLVAILLIYSAMVRRRHPVHGVHDVGG
jgi:hypothetical protein